MGCHERFNWAEPSTGLFVTISDCAKAMKSESKEVFVGGPNPSQGGNVRIPSPFGPVHLLREASGQAGEVLSGCVLGDVESAGDLPSVDIPGRGLLEMGEDALPPYQTRQPLLSRFSHWLCDRAGKTSTIPLPIYLPDSLQSGVDALPPRAEAFHYVRIDPVEV